MAAIIARTKPDENGNWDFVGIFEYDDVNEDNASLFFVLDEVVSPYACEFCYLDFGMGIFFDKERVSEDDTGEYDFDIPVKAFFSERLDDLINGQETAWFDIDFNQKEIYDIPVDAHELGADGKVH